MLIRKLEFGLENCEHITIDGKYIGHFYAGDIRKEIARMACNWIGMEEICHSFCVEIHKDANKTYTPFGIEKDRTLAFDRLTQWNDITDITIHLYDQYNEKTKDDESQDTVYHYLLHWGGEDDNNCDNPLQFSKIANTGWLYITVGATMKMEEIFPDAEVDDEEYSDHRAAMMDIGDKYWEEHETMLKQNSSNAQTHDLDEDKEN
jgi:hypothetical protein